MGHRRRLLDQSTNATSQLPLAVLKPELSTLEVPVDITEPQITDERFSDAMREMGVAQMGATGINALRDIGIKLDGVGAMRTQKGVTLVTQQRMLSILGTLAELVDEEAHSDKKRKAETICNIARTAGYVSRALNDSVKVQVELNGGSPRRSPGLDLKDEKPAQRGFIPGQDVKPGSTMVVGKEVHIHQTAPAAES